MALLFIFLTIAFTVAGQILVKQGMLEVGANPSQLSQFPGFLWRALTNPYVFLGFGSAFAASLTWIVAISRSELSFAYPFMGLPIVTVLTLSPIIFGETVPLTRWMGTVIVCVGIWIATR
jgi:multidrug transporter EmrE-like cation transporter